MTADAERAPALELARAVTRKMLAEGVLVSTTGAMAT